MPPSPPDDGPASSDSRANGEAGSSDATALSVDVLRTWPLPSAPTDDKHDRGTVLVVAGSVRTPGAALLPGIAALRAGAGRLQIASVESTAASLGVALPEALVEAIPATRGGALDPASAVPILAERMSGADAVLLGPGMEDLEVTRALLAGLLPLARPTSVIVLDALALRAWATMDPDTIPPLAGRLAFTPNRREAASLVPRERSGLGDGELASMAARIHGAAVTVSGHVAAPDGRCWVADGPVPGLGTSGSGDVLAGLVLGAAGRCGDAVQAACWGTYLHIEAGARLGERIGHVGYLARELAEQIPGLLHEATLDPR